MCQYTGILAVRGPMLKIVRSSVLRAYHDWDSRDQRPELRLGGIALADILHYPLDLCLAALGDRSVQRL